MRNVIFFLNRTLQNKIQQYFLMKMRYLIFWSEQVKDLIEHAPQVSGKVEVTYTTEYNINDKSKLLKRSQMSIIQ